MRISRRCKLLYQIRCIYTRGIYYNKRPFYRRGWRNLLVIEKHTGRRILCIQLTNEGAADIIAFICHEIESLIDRHTVITRWEK